MFLQLSPFELRRAKTNQTVRISVAKQSGRANYRTFIVRIPAAMLSRAGIESRVDIAIGALGTPDDGLIRITNGDTFALLSDSKGRYKADCMYVRFGAPAGMPLLRPVEAKAQEEAGMIIILVPQELRKHYETLARTIAVATENRVAREKRSEKNEQNGA